MAEARFRFYAELNDFLAPARRFTEFAHSFVDIATVKDRIESFGVPHTEVDLILVNGEPVEFSRRVRDGDRVSVYPVFEAFDIAPVTRLRPEPLREPRFAQLAADFLKSNEPPARFVAAAALCRLAPHGFGVARSDDAQHYRFSPRQTDLHKLGSGEGRELWLTGP